MNHHWYNDVYCKINTFFFDLRALNFHNNTVKTNMYRNKRCFKVSWRYATKHVNILEIRNHNNLTV